MNHRLTLISGIVLLGLNAPLLTDAIPGPWLSGLEFQREAIQRGEIWRLVTGQFVHWSAHHFLADAAAFLPLCLFLERRFRGRLLAFQLASAVLIGALLFFLDGELVAYRGASGIVHGLFVPVAVEMIQETRGRVAWRGFWMVVLAAGIAKPVLELITGGFLLPTGGLECMGAPAPLAHLGGVIAAPFLYLPDVRTGGGSGPPLVTRSGSA